ISFFFAERSMDAHNHFCFAAHGSRSRCCPIFRAFLSLVILIGCSFAAGLLHADDAVPDKSENRLGQVPAENKGLTAVQCLCLGEMRSALQKQTRRGQIQLAPQRPAKQLLADFAGASGTLVAFSHDDSRLLTAGAALARVWDVQTGRALTEPLKHEWPIRAGAISADGKRVVTAAGTEARVWDIASAATVFVLPHPE